MRCLRWTLDSSWSPCFGWLVRFPVSRYWLLWFGLDFSEDPINDSHLWLELIIASFLWFRAAAEVDWSATCDHFKTFVDCNFSACWIDSLVDLSTTRWECFLGFSGAQSWSLKTSSAFVQPVRAVVESRSYFGELWLDPGPERFLYPLFYTVCGDRF